MRWWVVVPRHIDVPFAPPSAVHRASCQWLIPRPPHSGMKFPSLPPRHALILAPFPHHIPAPLPRLAAFLVTILHSNKRPRRDARSRISIHKFFTDRAHIQKMCDVRTRHTCQRSFNRGWRAYCPPGVPSGVLGFWYFMGRWCGEGVRVVGEGGEGPGMFGVVMVVGWGVVVLDIPPIKPP